MTTVYQVQARDIVDLDQLQLTLLLKLLLGQEAETHALNVVSLEVGLNLLAADGGEDGRIVWSNGPPKTEFLPLRDTLFQNKAANLGPTQCATEFVDSKGRIKAVLDDLFLGGGAYVMFTTQILNGGQKRSRVKAIRERLRSLSKAYADTATIEVYDASKIETWTNKYVSAITAVLAWVGRPLVSGLRTWALWEQLAENRLFDFVVDDTRNGAIRDLRASLSIPRNSARVIGLSGLGKTRLALEVCRGDTEHPNLGEETVYIDAAAGISNLAGHVSDWAHRGLRGVAVVDNCDLALHKLLEREVSHANSRLSLLTLHYNPETNQETKTIRLGAMPDGLIKKMLEPVYGTQIEDLDRIVSFAQGFPQMAYLLARARLDQSKDMGSLTDDDLVKKMLWGGGGEDQAVAPLLQACALFDKFGREDEAADELRFIAQAVARCDEQKLYRCVKTYELRGIVSSVGRFSAIVPKPLAIRLAADWWRLTQKEEQKRLIFSTMPGQLEDSFCAQVAKLDFLPEVKQLAAALCGDHGPFGQAEVILSERGSNLFRALVEVNPVPTSESVFRVLSAQGPEKLTQIAGETRRNLVAALEKLCFHRAAFDRAARALLLLGSAENEKWSNNATGLFVQLFRVFLSGTEAEPEARLDVLDEALNSASRSVREVAVKALESAIDTHGGSRAVGAEYQGTGQPLEEWRPKIWQEAFDYWVACIERLTAVALDGSSESALAKEALGAHVRSLMTRGRDVMLAVDRALRAIVTKQGTYWPSALESLKNILNYDMDGLPDEARTILREWLKLLEPVTLNEKLRVLVSEPPFEHEPDAKGALVDVARQRAEALATALASDLVSVASMTEQLVHGEQRQGQAFGRQLVIVSRTWEPLLSELVREITSVSTANPSVLLGMLSGVFSVDPLAWNELIQRFVQDPRLAYLLPHVLTTGKIEPRHLDIIVELAREGRLDPTRATILSYGRVLDHILSAEVTRFVLSLSLVSARGAWTALDILSMYCFQSADKRDACKTSFADLLLRITLIREGRAPLEMHHWKEAADFTLQWEGEEYAKKLTSKIVSYLAQAFEYSDVEDYLKPVLRTLLAKHGRSTWPVLAAAFSKADALQRYRLGLLLKPERGFKRDSESILASLNVDILDDWCTAEPELAPPFVASVLDVLVEKQGTYQISPNAQRLIDRFGDNESVLRALIANVSSFGWTGSVVPYLQKEIDAFEPLRKHGIARVREWADRRIAYLHRQIAAEKISDAEESWGIR